METLYIDRKNCTLEAMQHRLVIHQSNGERMPASFPLMHLESVVITCDCALTTSTLRQLGASGVTVLALNPRTTDDAMVCYHMGHGNSMRRLRQYALQSQETGILRENICQLIVRHKLVTHIRQLQTLVRERADLRLPFTKAIERLKAQQLRVAQCSQGEAVLLGIEGAAARAYFEAFVQAFPGQLQFNGRKKRPAPDPVNSVLSLCYTLVHYEGVRAALSSGLDPQLGFLHKPAYNRDSLACDLTELLRARVNHWVWQLFRDRQLTNHDFYQDGDACLLSKAGRSKFYPVFQLELPRYRTLLRSYCRQLAHFLDTIQSITLKDAPR